MTDDHWIDLRDFIIIDSWLSLDGNLTFLGCSSCCIPEVRNTNEIGLNLVFTLYSVVPEAGIDRASLVIFGASTLSKLDRRVLNMRLSHLGGEGHFYFFTIFNG